MLESTFNGNSSGEGGGIYTAYRTSVSVEASEFTRNFAFNGGAMYAFISEVEVDASQFSSNYAETDGGALRLSATAQIQIDGSTFVNNETRGRGGAVYLYNLDAAARVRDSTFVSNTAGIGGAISLRDAGVAPSYLFIRDSQLQGNASNAIYAESQCTIEAIAVTMNDGNTPFDVNKSGGEYDFPGTSSFTCGVGSTCR